MIFTCTAPRTFQRYVARIHCEHIQRATERVVRRTLTGAVAVVCTNDRTMGALNRRYRGKDRTTDVLSFLYTSRKYARTQTIVGDILLSIPEVRRQARERKLSVVSVTDELIVHGLLHLLGYDHERSRKDERIMLRLQGEILGKLNIEH